uniref:DUF6815 domain-containing protein n=1 Tax=Zooxanthella nutricula TaxID=1333877 RepID=A0A6U6WM98_9DINO
MINASSGECWAAVPVAEQKWVVGEFNCSCVGISKCLPAFCKADTPDACYTDIPADDLAEADRYGSIMGKKALGILEPVDVSCLTKVATDDLGLLPNPKSYTYKGALAQIYVRCQPYGGSDKSSNGHRYDSIPFANGMISSGMSCQLIHYVHEEHDAFFKVCEKFSFIIVRCNPGQIKQDGGDQQKFDDAMRALQAKGKPVWPSPDVMEFMGAKDALTKIKDLNIGMPDTGTYYSDEEFIAGFKKTMKFQPRVIKQNRGSSGEGIWIINLKKGDYCKEFGDASVEDSDELILMEANDNHVEEHTVAEFVAWCIHGRDEGKGAGEWTSKGTGKYLEGGKAAGGQLTDQRFACRILEGELRFNMVNTVCLGVIHKVPAPGGMSAVGGTGSEYFYYDNGIISDEKLGVGEFTAYVQKEKSADGNYHRCATDEGEKKVEEGTHEKKTISIDLAALCKKFTEEDCPVLMKTLDLPNEPIPLWWTADMINASSGECWAAVPVAEQKWVVGEFNCSCVGVSKCLAACQPDKSWKDIPAEEAGHAMMYGDIVGKEAAAMLGVGAEKKDEAPKVEAPAEEEAPKAEDPKTEAAPEEAAAAA